MIDRERGKDRERNKSERKLPDTESAMETETIEREKAKTEAETMLKT